MSRKALNFTENDSTAESFKSSLFKALLKNRKPLLDSGSYPAVSKGLKFPDPKVIVGNAEYTFKPSDTVDKIVAKSGGNEISARYKKDTKRWDLALRQPLNNDINLLLKYEERGESQPAYVVGADVNNLIPNLALNGKFNFLTGLLKGSALYNGAGVGLNDVKIAADFKAHASSSSIQKFNVGASYSHPVTGLTSIAYNNRGLLTATHVMQVDKSLSLAGEIVQSNQARVGNPLTVAVGYKVDSDHLVRARLNKNAELNVCLDKRFSPKFNLLVATVVDVSNPEKLFQAPAVGLKVVAK